MKRSITLHALLTLAVGLAAVAAGPRRANAVDPPTLRPPDVTGCWLGTYQNELNRDDRGTIVVEITAQRLERLMGRMVVRGRGYVLEGTVTPNGEATLAGFEPGSDLPGAQRRVQGCFDVAADTPNRLRRRSRFLGSGIADLGRCCSRPVTMLLQGAGWRRAGAPHRLSTPMDLMRAAELGRRTEGSRRDAPALTDEGSRPSARGPGDRYVRETFQALLADQREEGGWGRHRP